MIDRKSQKELAVVRIFHKEKVVDNFLVFFDYEYRTAPRPLILSRKLTSFLRFFLVKYVKGKIGDDG